MSRRLLNNLGASKPLPPPTTSNPLELVMAKPRPVQHYIPNEPIFLTKEQWDFICNKTNDATTPFTVEITVIDKEDKQVDAAVGVEEMKQEVVEQEYIPKRVRKSKK